MLDIKIQNKQFSDRERHGLFSSHYCLLAFVTRFFTFLCILFTLLFLSLNDFCQPGGEFGRMGGPGYYLDEYNAGYFRHNQVYIAAYTVII